MFLETVDSYNINNAQTKESSITPTLSHGKAETCCVFKGCVFSKLKDGMKKRGRSLHDSTCRLVGSCYEAVTSLLFVNQKL